MKLGHDNPSKCFGTTAFEDAGILPVVSYRKITMEVDFVNILLGNDTI